MVKLREWMSKTISKDNTLESNTNNLQTQQTQSQPQQQQQNSINNRNRYENEKENQNTDLMTRSQQQLIKPSSSSSSTNIEQQNDKDVRLNIFGRTNNTNTNTNTISNINNKKIDNKSSQNLNQNLNKNKLRCQVTFLDETIKIFEIDKSANGQQLFDVVCVYLELIEKDYFSLTYRDVNNMKFWLDFEKKIKTQLKGVIAVAQPIFNFEVKFYPPEPNILQEEITRYLITLQLRHDIMDGKLPCSFVTHALLGSYSVQAELGDYDPEIHGHGYGYLEGFFFAPNQTSQLLEAVAEYHKDHKGQSPAEAEMHFLENAVKLAMYGVDLHNAKDSDGVDILIGVSASGLMVYRDHLRINRFSWPKILKISYKRNHFYLKLRAGEFEKYESTIGFRCPNHKAAKRLWKIAVEHHAFFRLREPEKPKKNILPTFNSRYRYTGPSTYMQTRYRSVERQQPHFDRSLSKHLTQSMDRGLAFNNQTPSGSTQLQRSNVISKSIPDKINNLRETDDENEYNTHEQRLPSIPGQQNDVSIGNNRFIRPLNIIPNNDASAGVLSNNMMNKKSITTPNMININSPAKQTDDGPQYSKINKPLIPSNIGGNVTSSTPILNQDRRYIPTTNFDQTFQQQSQLTPKFDTKSITSNQQLDPSSPSRTKQLIDQQSKSIIQSQQEQQRRFSDRYYDQSRINEQMQPISDQQPTLPQLDRYYVEKYDPQYEQARYGAGRGVQNPLIATQHSPQNDPKFIQQQQQAGNYKPATPKQRDHRYTPTDNYEQKGIMIDKDQKYRDSDDDLSTASSIGNRTKNLSNLIANLKRDNTDNRIIQQPLQPPIPQSQQQNQNYFNPLFPGQIKPNLLSSSSQIEQQEIFNPLFPGQISQIPQSQQQQQNNINKLYPGQIPPNLPQQPPPPIPTQEINYENRFSKAGGGGVGGGGSYRNEKRSTSKDSESITEATIRVGGGGGSAGSSTRSTEQQDLSVSSTTTKPAIPPKPKNVYVERTIVLNAETNHQEVLLRAIQIATALDPNLEVEKVEISTE